MTARPTRQATMLTITIVLLAAGCSAVKGDSAPRRPFPDARRQVEAFVQQTFSHAAPGGTPVSGPLDGHLTDCKDRYGRGDIQASWTYARQVEGIDGTLADAIVTRTKALWGTQGLVMRTDDKVPGVVHVFGRAPDDFGYELVVNRNEHFAYLSGSTPCYPYEDLPPRTPEPAP